MICYVLGGRGMFAYELNKYKPKNVDLVLVGKDKCDVSSYKSIRSFFSNKTLDVIINCAAITDQVRCEENPDLAFLVNTFGALNVAKFTKNNGIKLVHIGTMFSKDPTNQYTFSKYAGEMLVRLVNENAYIPRLAMPFGSDRSKNFDSVVINAIFSNKKLYADNYRKYQVVFVKDAVEHIFNRIGCDFSGFEYVFNSGKPITSFEFAKEICKSLNIDMTIIEPVVFEDVVKKPKYIELSGGLRHYKKAIKKWVGMKKKTKIKGI